MNHEKAKKTKLTEADRKDLFAIMHMPGWEILQWLMEMQCILGDVALMQVPPEDEKKVLAQHRMTLAKWDFFAEINKQVNFEVDEMLTRDKPREESDAEREHRELAEIVGYNQRSEEA